jgi:DNA-binding GntR family transcriptional regulator
MMTVNMKKQQSQTKTLTARRMLANTRAAARKSGEGRRNTSGVDQRIYDAVYGAVMRHRLPPGTKLTEASLCELFRVSRTLVRKALLRLAHDHILELRHNRGAVVASPSPQDTREIFAARRAIEAAIVPLVVGRAGKADLTRLRQHIRDEHAAFRKGDRSKWIRLTGEFHLALAAVAGNGVLRRYLSELVSRCSLIIALYDPPQRAFCDNHEHDGLIAAIAKGDVAGAVRLMDKHLRMIEDGLQIADLPQEINLAEILADA